MAWSIAVVAITGEHTIDIHGTPTRTDWFVLALLTLVLPGAATLGWAVSRIDDARPRRVVAAVSLGIAVLGGFPAAQSAVMFVDLAVDAVVLALIFICRTRNGGRFGTRVERPG